MQNKWLIGIFAALIMAVFFQGIAVADPGVQGHEGITVPAKPPQRPMSPAPVGPDGTPGGEARPYLYDLQTGAQMDYWRRVMIVLADKVNKIDNTVEIADLTNLWQFIDRNKDRLSITAPEAKVLCLIIPEEKFIPHRMNEFTGGTVQNVTIANWPDPDWPRCGNVLEDMFGPGFYKYISERANDQFRLDVYRELIKGMGFPPKMLEATINKNIDLDSAGQHVVLEDSQQSKEVCYNSKNNIRKMDYGNCGILCRVTSIVTSLLNAASQAIVLATAGNAKFTSAVIAAIVLYVTVFGAMVVLGLSQLSMGEALIRIVKVAAVGMLLSSTTIMQFFNIIRCFFIEGATFLSNSVLTAGLEAVAELGTPGDGVTLAAPTFASTPGTICADNLAASTSGKNGPLIVLEAVLGQVFSNHMFLTISTLFIANIQGFLLVLFLLYGLFMFLVAILTAVTLYLSSLIAMYLLLSMMPIFIAFVMFEKTKYLFNGWISQIAANALIPIFLFAYISLFIVIIEAALAQIIDNTICWRKWMTVAWVFDIYKYQFVDAKSGASLIGELPFGFFEVLIFIILVMILKEFEESVKEIAEYVAGEMSSGYRLANAIGQNMKQLPGKVIRAGYNRTRQSMHKRQVNRAHSEALEQNASFDAARQAASRQQNTRNLQNAGGGSRHSGVSQAGMRRSVAGGSGSGAPRPSTTTPTGTTRHVAGHNRPSGSSGGTSNPRRGMRKPPQA